jgi:Na+:H+ antiporter
VAVHLAKLRPFALFSGLDDGGLEQIAEAAELRTAARGDVLAREGASGYTFFLVSEGAVDVERGGRALETLGAGDFFGEMAIVGSGRRNATVTARSDVELIVLFGSDFRLLEHAHPDAAARIREKVAERVAGARDSA